MMPKFRKKPVVVEAEQFHRRHFPWPGGVQAKGNTPEEYEIQTLEGPFIVSPGDWIIMAPIHTDKDGNEFGGERYPCKPDIFEATYEEVIE